MHGQEMSKTYKLAALTSHPIQYQAPLFRKLAQHSNIDLTVYFCGDFGVEKEQYAPEFGRKIKWDIPLLEGYKYRFLPNLSPKPSSFFFGQMNASVIKAIWQNNYDAIWIHGYTTFTDWLAFLVARIKGVPVLLRGESHLLNQRPLWKRGLKYAILTALFKSVSAFLPIGTLNKAYYKHYGVIDEKMFLTPYAVDNDFFHGKYKELNKKLNKEELKKEKGFRPDLPIILYVSKMIPRKRAMGLLRAYHLISDIVDAQLVFVGDGMERPLLESYVKEHCFINVYFTGFTNQTELPIFYAMSDIFVLPSADEPWGLVINEAMNFSLSIVTTDSVGAAHDLVKDGENGFVYPVGDIERLATCLLKLVQNSELREEMGKRSLEIISKWSYEEDARGILAALDYVSKVKR